jgi:hypothetical protein
VGVGVIKIERRDLWVIIYSEREEEEDNDAI